MTKKHGALLQELDIKDVEGYTEAQKAYYLSLGFKPYLNSAGKVKWLMPDQHSLRMVSSYRKPLFRRIFNLAPPLNYRRRKHRSALTKILQHNWLWFLLFFLIGTTLVVLMHYPQIIR